MNSKLLDWTKDWVNKKPPNGEKFKDVMTRVKPWFDEILPVVKQKGSYTYSCI